MTDMMHPVYTRHLHELGLYERLIRNEIMDMIRKGTVYCRRFNELTDEYNEIRNVWHVMEQTEGEIVYLSDPHFGVIKKAVNFITTGRTA